MAKVTVKWDEDKKVWCSRLYLGTDSITKKPIRPYRQFPDAKDEAEALTMAEQWAAGFNAARDLSIRQRLDSALELYIRTNELDGTFTPSTAKTYRSLVRCYVNPTLGSRDPRSIEAYEIQNLYRELALSGSRVKGRGIAKSKVKQVHWFLSGAWKWMIAPAKIATENPVASLGAPHVPTIEAKALSEGEWSMLKMEVLEVLAQGGIEGFPYEYALATLIAMETGARCGEVCALREVDVWWRSNMLHIGGTVIEVDGPPKVQEFTKGKRSRNLRMSKLLGIAIQAGIERSRKVLGIRRTATTMPVCCDDQGLLLRPSKVSEAFTEFARSLRLMRGTKFHTIRHTHASILLAEGMDFRTLAEHLGHYDASITMKIYAHMMPGRDGEVAEALDRMNDCEVRELPWPS